MANQVIVRYEINLPLGSGGGRIGTYRTLEAAKKAKAKSGRDDLQIWRMVYHKTMSGKFYNHGASCVG